ncbi:MAG: FAD-binding oxidoreductase, partial [Acidimicrobiia bacterium]|nr:FAD-binding oxidoreductase [Acidimicrobiia bacterium]
RELLASMDAPPARGLIARGLGRSYGDAAQNAGGRVVATTGVHEVDLDPTSGTVTAGGGVSLDTLMRILVPRGFFVPVTPGTRHVTVGGAIAADIHGKNHHRVGSWCNHVRSLHLLTPDGTLRNVVPDDDAFWATAGGMGLTGTVVDATFTCPSIETSSLVVDTERASDLGDALARMTERDHLYDYSVAWIDLMATGGAMGRSVLTRGRFARADELDPTGADPLAFDPREIVMAPPWVPPGLLNRLSVRAFNELWFRRAPEHRTDELQSISAFFHPLDMVQGWNRMYGTRGFLQWQFVLPLERTTELRRIVERLSAAGCTSFLAVLKRFGPANRGPLSFPDEGWTLALDIPAGLAGLGPLLDSLDRTVAEAGGRVYLAKDSRLDPALVPVMYPRLDEWRAARAMLDPDGVLRSDLSRRLGLSSR